MEAICAAWLVGIAWQLGQARLWGAEIYLVLFLAAGAGLAWMVYAWRQSLYAVQGRYRRWGQRVLVWALLVCMGFAWAGWRAAHKMADAMPPGLERQDILVEGVVDTLPQLQSGRWRFTLEVKTAELNGEPVQLPAKLQLSWYFSTSAANGTNDAMPDIHVGQHWRFEVRLRAPHGSMNPHGFDYELWLWGQGIGAVGYVRTAKNAATPQLLADAQGSLVEHWREQVRGKIMHTVPDARQAGLLAALTLGDQRAISRDDWQIFRTTGVAHLVSISGLHITMMAWLAMCLINWLWRRSVRLMLWLPAHTAAAVGGLLCAVLYALFAGWGIPAQRTVLMLATVVLLRVVGIRWPWYTVWCFAAAVVVAADPWALLQAGFWLSFIAVGVLLVQATDGIDGQKQLERKKQNSSLAQLALQPWWQRLWKSIWRSCWQLLVVQWRISIALAPLTLLLFQQVSVVGLVANLFAIPWVTFVMVPLSLLGMVWHPLWLFAAWAADVLLAVLQWLSGWTWAVWSSAVPPWPVGVAAVLGAVVLVLPTWRWRYRLLGLLMLIPVLVWQPTRVARGEFEVIALDVGQGSAVLVRTATHDLLYDTGPKYTEDSDAGSLMVVPALHALGVHLDRVVVSHVDADHAGGLYSVLAAYPQADLLASAPSGDVIWQSTAADHISCVAGLSWQWDDVQFTVLHPTVQMESQGNSRALSGNAQSCVLRVAATNAAGKEVAALLTGDIEAKQEGDLVARSEDCSARIHPTDPIGASAADSAEQQCGTSLHADWLLAPHHGSKTSSSEAFLDAVNPHWVVVQSGYLNRFGHPDEDVLKRYSQHEIQLVNTVNCGAATWRSDAPEQMQCERMQRSRYWHHQVQ
ncbi:DNA internalization-related competence protein ComEC/Rec2 [Saezia sanguinis]|uniref:DNA internalization-related competence protein ComEC/Rec2 n=1 Tax=Saezia sanguinis TaxID=1965230 RepID=UPI003069AD26